MSKEKKSDPRQRGDPGSHTQADEGKAIRKRSSRGRKRPIRKVEDRSHSRKAHTQREQKLFA
jgi:hypothetical protein